MTIESVTEVIPAPAAPQPRSLTSRPVRADRIFRTVCYAAGGVTVAIMLAVGVFLSGRASEALTRSGPAFLWTQNWAPESNAFGIAAVLFGTVTIALVALTIAVPLSLGTALLIGFAFAVAVGFASGILIAYATIPAIFTTLAMGLIVYGSGRAWLFQVDVQNTPANSEFFNFLAQATVLGIPMMIVAFAVLAVIVWALLKWTRFGRFVYATGDNPSAARVAGIPTRYLMVAQYVITAIIAYLAGLIMAAANSGMSTRVYNSTMIYDVLLVAVLGGIGLSGGRGGVLLNGMTIFDIPYTQQNLIKSVILLIAIVIDSIVNPRDEQTAQQEQGDI